MSDYAVSPPIVIFTQLAGEPEQRFEFRSPAQAYEFAENSELGGFGVRIVGPGSVVSENAVWRKLHCDAYMHPGREVTAKRPIGSVDPGEPGIVYRRYILGGRPGYSVIFRGGFYDGFSPEEVARFLEITPKVHEHMSSYCFENVGRLQADFLAGRIWR